MSELLESKDNGGGAGISLDVYNSVAGFLTAILMQLQAVAELPAENVEMRKECLLRAEDLARRGLRQVRETVEMNILGAGSKEGALMAMQVLVETAAPNTYPPSTFEVKGAKRSLKNSVALTLQRVLQEALSNSRRHSHAEQIEVQLCFEDDRVVLEVNDDGRGFVLETSIDLGFGLVGMKARIDKLGGSLWLRTSPGHGTKVRVDVPSPYEDH